MASAVSMHILYETISPFLNEGHKRIYKCRITRSARKETEKWCLIMHCEVSLKHLIVKAAAVLQLKG